MKNLIIALLVLGLGAAGLYLFINRTPVNEVPTTGTETETESETGETPVVEDKEKTVIGKSDEGRDIVAYHFGTGDKEILFVGGIHGGYSWNTVLVARETMEYLKANPTAVPANVKVTVIPVLNPDGLLKVVGTSTSSFAKADVSTSQATQVSGRFNANTVDLNRNFDCDWQANGTWQNRTVSGGSAAFSEPESQAIKNYIEANEPDAVIVWYSAAGGVFASSCHDGVLPETLTLTNLYAKASGYKEYRDFDFYEITGDMVNWFAKEGIPAISVLLTTHTDTDWSKNKAGIDAVLKHYAE